MAYDETIGEVQIKAEVTKAFEQLADAAKTLDLDGYFSLFDKQQFTSLNHDGTVLHEFAKFESMFRLQMASVEKYISLEFKNVKISVPTPSICVLVNEYSAKLQLRSGETLQAKGAGTQIWCNTSGKWLLIHVASSAGN